MSHAETIQNNNNVLLRCTTINLYVIDSLRAEDVVDEAQDSDLRTEKNPRKQRILVFEWLKEVSSDKYESFLKVMKDTEQEHVANLLTGSTEGKCRHQLYSKFNLNIQPFMHERSLAHYAQFAQPHKWKLPNAKTFLQRFQTLSEYNNISRVLSKPCNLFS